VSKAFPLPISKLFSHIPYELFPESDINPHPREQPPWELLGYLQRLLESDHSNKMGEIKDDRIVIINSIVHPSAKLGDFVIIKNSYIGEDASVGNFCELSKSIMLPRSKAGRSDYLCKTIVGSETTICGNVRTATRRVDLCIPQIPSYGIVAPYNRIGSFIGDNVFIASSVLLNPFTFIMPGVNILPFQSMKGVCNLERE